MITISLCMIVKNEESVLERCLNSVGALADEIILVDTGSTDRTKEVARKYTNDIYDFEWIDDFAAARNFSFSKAKMEYCMWLDADDVILESDRCKLLQLKKELTPETDVVMLPYHVGFDESGTPTFLYYRERIIRAQAGLTWKGFVHEAVAGSGKRMYYDAAITHQKPPSPEYSNRNLLIYEKQLAKGTNLNPRDQFYYARELYYHGQYEKAISCLTDLLDSGDGWIENLIEGCRCLAQCYFSIGEDRKALYALLHSLEYSAARSEICCDIGQYFLSRNQYEQAIFWYELALSRPESPTNGAFWDSDCHRFLPCIQLCVCYDAIGKKDIAESYNEKAGVIKPYSASYLHNKNYFTWLRQIKD